MGAWRLLLPGLRTFPKYDQSSKIQLEGKLDDSQVSEPVCRAKQSVMCRRVRG